MEIQTGGALLSLVIIGLGLFAFYSWWAAMFNDGSQGEYHRSERAYPYAFPMNYSAFIGISLLGLGMLMTGGGGLSLFAAVRPDVELTEILLVLPFPIALVIFLVIVIGFLLTVVGWVWPFRIPDVMNPHVRAERRAEQRRKANPDGKAFPFD
ncbi:MAG: hypothetical protein Q4P05_07765 [Actinomycetaceae bacterium]|nr:hypothetical protein [Actinomycetaceae bacterium]